MRLADAATSLYRSGIIGEVSILNRIAIPALLLLVSCQERSIESSLEITNVWARESAAGQGSAAAYLTIDNHGDADRLVAVSAPATAQMAMLHSSSTEGGIARMRHLGDGLPVPARARTELRPGANHIMLTGLKGPLRRGTSVDLDLRFEHAGERRVPLTVVSAVGDPPGNRGK